MDRLVRFWLSRRVFYDNPMFPLRFVRVDGQERGRVWTKWGCTSCTFQFAFKRCAKTKLSKAHFRDVFPTIHNECRNTRQTLCLISSSSGSLEHNRRVVLPCRGLAQDRPPILRSPTQLPFDAWGAYWAFRRCADQHPPHTFFLIRGNRAFLPHDRRLKSRRWLRCGGFSRTEWAKTMPHGNAVRIH